VAVDDDGLRVPGTPARGADRTLVLELPYADARDGCIRFVTIVHDARCRRCGGTGDERGVTYPCQGCAGKGCAACHHSGRFAESPCDSCDHGLIEDPETVRIVVPKGARTGDQVVCAGNGDAVRTGPPGDLHVTIKVDTIGVLVQRGDDVVLELEVTARQLLFGGVREVATLDGLVTIELPRGIRDGHTVTLAGRGYVRITGSERTVGDPYRELARGDQLVVFRVPPDVLRARARVLLGTVVTLGVSAILTALAL
jgi:molecular chaperone DnaJ